MFSLLWDVSSAAVIPAGLHHLPRSPEAHLSHPLPPPGTRRQEFRSQRRSGGAELRPGNQRTEQKEGSGEETEEESGHKPSPEADRRKEKVNVC